MDILRIFDNQGETIDRYTAILDDSYIHHITKEVYYTSISMSHNPDSPLGVSQYGDCIFDSTINGENYHLGNEILFTELPKNIQEHLLKRIE